MPRAIDPSLAGGGLPISHDPLSTIQYNVIPNPMDLLELLEMIIDGFADTVRDFIFPAIEQLTGIDLSMFLPLLEVLNIDFSSPEAFLMSLINSIIALPGVLLGLLSGLLGGLGSSPFDINNLITNILQPTGLIATLDMILGIPIFAPAGQASFPHGFPFTFEPGTLVPSFPHSFPFTFGNLTTQVDTDLTRFFSNLLSFLPLNFSSSDFDLTSGITDFIEGILGPSGLLATLFNGKLPDDQAPNIVQGIIDSVAGIFGGGLPDIEQRLGGLDLSGLFDASFLGNILGIPALDDSSVPGVESLRDNIVTQLFGWLGFGFTHEQVADALHQQTNTLTSAAADIDAIWTQIDILNTPTLMAVTENFTRTAPTLGANWSSPGAGEHWECDGDEAVFVGLLGSGDVYRKNRWIATPAVSTGDYQTIKVTLGSGPSLGGLFGENNSSNTAIGRMDSTETYYIEFTVYADATWQLQKFLNNVGTTMANGTLATAVGAATTLTLICGDKETLTPRHFTCLVNTVTVTAGTFGDTTSAVGVGYRGMGFGGAMAAGFLDLFPGVPGNVNQWIGQDTA